MKKNLSFVLLTLLFSSTVFGQSTTYTDKYNLEMVLIPAGTFTMGSPIYEPDRETNETEHEVSLSKFYMSKYELTFDQFDAFCEATGFAKPADEGWGRGNRPVVNVSWDDANMYIKWLNKDTGKTYRLPTEAEWEYACRAGSISVYSFGGSISSKQVNFKQNIGKTIPVGSYPANGFGLYDMHGNVWEWCSDWYGASTTSQTNPTGASTGSYRVLRGGSWDSHEQYCRSADRGFDMPSGSAYDLGFRLACSTP